MDAKTPKEFDMSKAHSKERDVFFHSSTLKLAGLSIVILLIFCLLFVAALYFNKELLATNILDIMKFLVGVLVGGISSKIANEKL